MLREKEREREDKSSYKQHTHNVNSIEYTQVALFAHTGAVLNILK
jgi:hypothetical protein